MHSDVFRYRFERISCIYYNYRFRERFVEMTNSWTCSKGQPRETSAAADRANLTQPSRVEERKRKLPMLRATSECTNTITHL